MTEKEVLDLEISRVSTVYLGRDNCCRCGCGGDYVYTSYMDQPRGTVNDSLALRRIKQAKKLITEGKEWYFGGNYINVSYGNDRAITIYTDEIRK
jgi:hypothetical protein